MIPPPHLPALMRSLVDLARSGRSLASSDAAIARLVAEHPLADLMFAFPLYAFGQPSPRTKAGIRKSLSFACRNAAQAGQRARGEL